MSDGSPPTEPCTNRQPPTGSVGKFGEYKDAFGIYEDGKHRRYSLLFAVNGAIAAIVKLAPKDDLGTRGSVLLAVLMIIFTGIMGWDIWLFGKRMRKDSGDKPKGTSVDLAKGKWAGIFSYYGRIVLIACCVLIVIGWVCIGLWGPSAASTK
jgi:hypothetical protein